MDLRLAVTCVNRTLIVYQPAICCTSGAVRVAVGNVSGTKRASPSQSVQSRVANLCYFMLNVSEARGLWIYTLARGVITILKPALSTRNFKLFNKQAIAVFQS